MFRVGLISNVLGILFAVLGLTGFIIGMLFNFNVIDFESELPLSDVKGLVVDEKGQIFVGLGFYQKVQVYDKSGNFIRNWPVDASGGYFELDLEDNNILLTSARNDKDYLYNEFGENLRERKTDYLPHKNEYSFNAISGERFEIKGLLFTSIERTLPSNKTIIKQNIFMHLIKGPFPSLLFAGLFFGFGTLFLNFNKVKKRRLTY